jgi:putative hemolysin
MDGDPLGGQLLLQAVLIFVNAFFASAEMAVVSLNTNLLKKKAEDGDKKAEKLLKLSQEPTQFLSAIQIAITLAGFLGSAFAADNFADKLVNWIYNDLQFTSINLETLNSLMVIAITLILSFFTLVFGELVPKRVAMHSPEKMARLTSPVVTVVKVVLAPVIWMLSVSTNLILRIFGIKPGSEEEQVTEDEIRLMVDIGEETGTIDAKASEMIDNIFEFDNSIARNVMTRAIDITSIHSTATDEEILKVLRESAYSRFPVYNEDINDIVGILYAKDFYIDRLRDGKDTPLLELLRTASFVPETVKCDKLFFEMQKNNRHIALVVDEYGAVSGLVTLEDLLEEIVGNIYDEYDEEEKEEEEKDITLLEDNLWRVAGFTEIEELAEVVGFTLPEDREYDTLGGMVMSELSQIPDDGDQSIEVECCGIHIKVEKIEERRIEWALVSKLDTTDEVDGEEEKND